MKRVFTISALILLGVCLWPDCAYAIAFTAAAAAGLTGAALATAGTIGVVGLAGAGAYAASKMFGGSKSSQSTTPQPLPEPPSVDKAEVAAKESIEKKRRAVARNKTIFTSPFGLAEEDKSGLATKTLLGE
jgi:hypothetical protein